ncbi:glycosyltransferase family 2 protein [Gordonia sp. zg691]|nr:glycosyltransferase family 2 protein [Gordonia jinghuaiqii]
MIIVGYNSAAVIGNCLQGLYVNNDIEVVLVDNASTDATIETAVAALPAIRVLSRRTNDGFAVAVNEGVRISSGRVVVLLNPDALANAEDVLRLADRIDDGAAVCGAKIGASGDRTIAAGRFPSIWRITVHAFGLNVLSRYSAFFEGVFLLRHKVGRSSRPVDWVSGGCMAVSRGAWVHLGGLSEKWFMYGEDVHFCWRASNLDYGILLDASVDIPHTIGGSSQGVDGRMSTTWLQHLYEVYANMSNCSRVSGVAWQLIATLGFLIRALVFWGASLVCGSSTRTTYRNRARRFRTYSRTFF